MRLQISWCAGRYQKGENFDSKTDEEIQSIENWINNYPRRIHEYRTAGELFAEEVRKIG